MFTHAYPTPHAESGIDLHDDDLLAVIVKTLRGRLENTFGEPDFESPKKKGKVELNSFVGVNSTTMSRRNIFNLFGLFSSATNEVVATTSNDGEKGQATTSNDAEKGQDKTVSSSDKIAKYARRVCRQIYALSLDGSRKQSLDCLKKIVEEIPMHEISNVLYEYRVEKISYRDENNKNGKYIQVFARPICFAFEISPYEVCKYLHDTLLPKLDQAKINNLAIGFLTMCATRNPDREVLPFLLTNYKEHKPWSFRQKTDRYNTPLHYACYAGDLENVQLLLDKIRESPFVNVAKDNQAEKKVPLYRVPNKLNQTPMHWACSGGNPEIVKLIFEEYEKEDLLDENQQYQKFITDKETKQQSSKTDGTNKQELMKLGNSDDSNKLEKLKKRQIRAEFEKMRGKKFGEDCFKEQALNTGAPVLFSAMNFHYECIEFIFDNQLKADGTVRDVDCDTILHYVSQDPDFNGRTYDLAKILKANALLGVKNVVGNTPLDWISPEAVKTVLDQHVQKIEIPKDRKGVSQKDRYEILFTNLFGHHASGADILNINALANSPKHQELALHPVCQSILSVKWQKMKKYYLAKLLFFIPFVVLLSLYPVMLSEYETKLQNPNNFTTEEQTASYDSVNILWHVIFALWLIQVIFGSLSVFVMFGPFWKETKSYMAHWSVKRVRRLLEYYWIQLQWSDWYEYILWVLAIMLLYDSITPIPVVLMSWFSLFFVCSNHPSVLPFRYILVKILFRYVKFLMFAFGLISGFAMGFYLLMKECKNNDGEPCANGAFANIFTTALKVPAMMMGEISFEAFPLDIDVSPRVYFLFGAFIFLITCCLFNMMNGLAINITQEMMQRAHIFKTIAECDMIYEFEVMLTEITAWLKWFGIREINMLAPLWVERLRASPSSGMCYNLDEYDEKKHGSRESIDTDGKKRALLWETNKGSKVKWIWGDRGYFVDRKIVYEANVLIERLLKKEKIETENKRELEEEVNNVTEEDAEKDNDEDMIAKRRKDRLLEHSVIYQDPAIDESSDEEPETQSKEVTGRQFSRSDSMKPSEFTNENEKMKPLVPDLDDHQEGKGHEMVPLLALTNTETKPK